MAGGSGGFAGAGGASGGAGGGASRDGGAPERQSEDGGSSSELSAYKVYLGQTHAHTSYSFDTGGSSTPAQAFAAAKAKGADFYFITDHVDAMYGTITPAQFQMTKTMAEAATDATFVAAAGIEFHLKINEINSFGFDFTEAHGKLSYKGNSADYLDALKVIPGAFAQWNHPGRKPDLFDNFAGYTPERDAVISLLELLNGTDEVYPDEYQKALDAGWHIGPSAGHDNHGSDWFVANTRTGVLATSLTRDKLYEAIRQSRVFCSQDPGLKIVYDLNGSVMGTTIAPASTYKATVRIEGGKGVTKVEIISKGGIVVTSGAPAQGIWSADIAAKTENFYYARLTGPGSVKSWTAPVWVGP